jgi:hypothetical protein
VQCLKERHQRSSLRRTEILSIGWHIAPALDHLANELICSETYSDTVKRWAALTSLIVERMTVVTLLRLKNQRTPTLQGGAPPQVF